MTEEKPKNGLLRKMKNIVSGENCCCCNVKIVPEKPDENAEKPE
ncbi:hypothetical protein [Methanorbis furvi]